MEARGQASPEELIAIPTVAARITILLLGKPRFREESWLP